jgi:hypothetical protein
LYRLSVRWVQASEPPNFPDNSSSSDDSDIEELLDDNTKHMVVMLDVKDLNDRNTKKRWRSIVGRLCIPRNRTLGHNMLVRD